MMSHLPVLMLISVAIIPQTAADRSMDIFCYRPPNFGKGTYNQQSNTCDLTYEVTTLDKEAAFEFCDMQHPYSTQEATPGSTTKCKIIAELECGSSETLIGERCFLYDADTEIAFADQKCKDHGNTYSLHKVTSNFEQKWISTFFSNYGMLWVANKKEDLPYLIQSDIPDGKILVNKEGRLVDGVPGQYVIVLRKGSSSRSKIGGLAPMTPNAKIPILCSAPAKARPEYLTSLASKLNGMGFKSTFAQDLAGVSRPFTVVRAMQTFEINAADLYTAGSQRLQRSCEAFHHGYAATPFDFKNVEDFKRVLKEAAVNIVAVPGSRMAGDTKPNIWSCSEKDGSPEVTRRSAFYFDIRTAEGTTIRKRAHNGTFWSPSFPTRTCGDMPRVAMGFSQYGLVDIPNNARLFVLCTFGAPPNVRADEEVLTCPKLAKYNKEAKSCRCSGNDVEDLKDQTKFPLRESEASLPRGSYCVYCHYSKRVDIGIIMQHSPSTFARDFLQCLRLPFVYYNARFRRLAVGPSGIIADESFDGAWTKQNSEYNFQLWLPVDPGYPSVYNAISEIAHYLRYSPVDKKIVLYIFENVPGDMGEINNSFEEIFTPAGNVDHYVTVKEHDQQFTRFSSSGEVHLWGGHSIVDACNAATPFVNLLLRKTCMG